MFLLKKSAKKQTLYVSAMVLDNNYYLLCVGPITDQIKKTPSNAHGYGVPKLRSSSNPLAHALKNESAEADSFFYW